MTVKKMTVKKMTVKKMTVKNEEKNLIRNLIKRKNNI